MADRQEERAILRSLLSQRIPEEADIALTDVQVDTLLDAGYTNETLLAGLQREDLPESTFLPAVRNLLLRLFATQAGKPFGACSQLLSGKKIFPAAQPPGTTDTTLFYLKDN